MQLSFSHIMKHWKRNPNQGSAKVPGSRNVLLRFYPPQTAQGKSQIILNRIQIVLSIDEINLSFDISQIHQAERKRSMSNKKMKRILYDAPLNYTNFTCQNGK